MSFFFCSPLTPISALFRLLPFNTFTDRFTIGWVGDLFHTPGLESRALTKFLRSSEIKTKTTLGLLSGPNLFSSYLSCTMSLNIEWVFSQGFARGLACHSLMTSITSHLGDCISMCFQLSFGIILTSLTVPGSDCCIPNTSVANTSITVVRKCINQAWNSGTRFSEVYRNTHMLNLLDGATSINNPNQDIFPVKRSCQCP
jgi:hypothetical protein